MLRCCVGRSVRPEIWKRALSTTIPKSSERTSSADASRIPLAEPPEKAAFVEIEIPVPWGHIAGKWWGSQSETPVIGIHGFQDNAGSYDRLAPLMDVPAFFAWDAPGHGRSSHMPHGHTYHFADFLIALRLLVRRFGWEKISLVGHSWGSALALMYAALYPNTIERYVSIECVRTLMPNVGANGADKLRAVANHMVKCDKVVESKVKPPQYHVRDARNMIVESTLKSVQYEYCDPLISRGTLPNPENPETLYFSTDHRLRPRDVCRPTNSLLDEACRQIRCHVMYIYAQQGFMSKFINVVGQDVRKSHLEQESNMKELAASFQSHFVEGTHHVHLNNPERVAPLINIFFR